ncbi:MAG: T9SS type A sorting domain-containing protein [Bacteroidetes bacterium]|nr:T9SS type A sorting domain-containing protein [Bacteroidota bacterium]
MQLTLRRIFAVLCLGLLTSLCHAQPARIDSTFVDETKGELVVFGDLGATQGFVFVDSVSMPVVSWTDSVCRATIPVSGKGSAGLVEIGARGYRSDGRMLTSYRPWYREYIYQNSAYYQGHGFDKHYYYYYHYRADIESRLKSGVPTATLMMAADAYGTVNDIEVRNFAQSETTYTVKFMHGATLGIMQRKLIFGYGGRPEGYDLDAQYRPISASGNSPCGARDQGDCIEWGDDDFSFPPRPEYRVLAFQPILSPSDSSYFDGDVMYLSWNAPTTPVSFELQYGLDSAFTVTSDDTILSMTSFTTDMLATGYWRVRVKDSVAHGPWSNIARVKYLGVNSVRSTQSMSTAMLSPNPCTSTVAIQFPTVSSECILFDLLGRAVAKSDANGELRQTLDVSTLAEGLYFARVFDGKASSILQLFVKR